MTNIAVPPEAAKKRPLDNPLLRAALSYAKRGIPVLPLHNPVGHQCSCGDPKCARIGKHPRIMGGYLSASTDPVQIENWWAEWPDANIGIAITPESGLLVVDVDGPEGILSLRKLLKSKKLPGTLVAITGRVNRRGKPVGVHLYFVRPKGLVLRNTSGRLGKGIEVKAWGHVVAPPSLHASGRRYRWVNPDAPILSAPDWLTTQSAERAAVVEGDESGPIPDGCRNVTLFRIGKRLRWSGLSEDEVERELIKVNRERCDPPKDVDEVQEIAANVFTYADNESLLTKAWGSVQAAGYSRRREKFIALVDALWDLRGEQEILLPVKTLAPLLECGPRQVSSLRAWAERLGIIEKVGDYIPHVMSQKFRVLRIEPKVH